VVNKDLQKVFNHDTLVLTDLETVLVSNVISLVWIIVLYINKTIDYVSHRRHQFFSTLLIDFLLHAWFIASISRISYTGIATFLGSLAKFF